MVHFFTQKFQYEHPWEQVTIAIFQKYPNPFASHVLTSDVIERYVDPETGILHTTRLFLKKGTIPKWGLAILRKSEAYILETSTVDPRTKTMTTVTRNLSLTKIMLVEDTQIVRPLQGVDSHVHRTFSDTNSSSSTATTHINNCNNCNNNTSSSWSFIPYWMKSSNPCPSNPSLSNNPHSFEHSFETSQGTQIITKARIVSNTGWDGIKSRIESFGVTRFKDNTARSAQGLKHVLEKIQDRFKNST